MAYINIAPPRIRTKHQQIVDNFNYKPGFQFLVKDNKIILNHETKDVYSDKQIVISTWVLPHKDCTEEDIIALLKSMVIEIELHEALEHITYKGKRIFNPHN